MFFTCCIGSMCVFNTASSAAPQNPNAGIESAKFLVPDWGVHSILCRLDSTTTTHARAGNIPQVRARIFKLLRIPGIGSKESIPQAYVARARICKPFKVPRNQFPAWRAGTPTLFVVTARHATHAGGIESSESIPSLLKRLPNTGSGGPVRQPYSYSVFIPCRLFKNSSTGLKFYLKTVSNCK